VSLCPYLQYNFSTKVLYSFNITHYDNRKQLILINEMEGKGQEIVKGLKSVIRQNT